MNTFVHKGYRITVRAGQNNLGAWIAAVTILHPDGGEELRPETVQPEWRTEEEASRDGVEWATHIIDQRLSTPPNEA